MRNYDKKEVDPNLLSTDSVLTKLSSSQFLNHKPVAIERGKEETRIFMYTGVKGEPQEESWKQYCMSYCSILTIVDELTGDKYLCRTTDNDYFKYVEDLKRLGRDTIKIYQSSQFFIPWEQEQGSIWRPLRSALQFLFTARGGG